jgi:hypothetical protein
MANGRSCGTTPTSINDSSPVDPDRIDGRWDASDDGGNSWRKDFDLIFERVAS